MLEGIPPPLRPPPSIEPMTGSAYSPLRAGASCWSLTYRELMQPDRLCAPPLTRLPSPVCSCIKLELGRSLIGREVLSNNPGTQSSTKDDEGSAMRPLSRAAANDKGGRAAAQGTATATQAANKGEGSALLGQQGGSWAKPPQVAASSLLAAAAKREALLLRRAGRGQLPPSRWVQSQGCSRGQGQRLWWRGKPPPRRVQSQG